MVAHRSGGPQMDIVIEEEGSRNGFLAADENEFAIAIVKILRMSPRDRRTIREAARYVSVTDFLLFVNELKLIDIFMFIIFSSRSSVDRFSVREFDKGFLRSVAPFFNQSLS